MKKEFLAKVSHNLKSFDLSVGKADIKEFLSLCAEHKYSPKKEGGNFRDKKNFYRVSKNE